MDKKKISHDILNILDRLRIMHDLAREQNFRDISKDELKEDLQKSLRELEASFEQLLQ